ncbi:MULTISPECIES: hypothetical protein [unclassified Bradyrhizobium]|uniref:hypothetical protein n=1 Tax=unclassified Bradyrhizobium TaxID=2631580 RepID=UPI001FFA0243|nr:MULTISPECIES: hypothetical protein [unclassified Bradyrhizobium]
MLAGHFAVTAMRCAASDGPILILQDTTEFIYSRAQPGKIGLTKTINAGRYKAGQPQRGNFVRGADAFEPGCNLGPHAARADGSEVLDTHKVQGDLEAREACEPHACTHRDEGKLSLA